jgi:5'-3' exonuclease
LWRKDLYPEYKEGRPHFDEERARLVKESQEVAVLLLNNMKVTQYIKRKNEADDLIYAFVRAHEGEKIVIVSSDGDIVQIPYHCDWVDVHNPGKKEDIIEIPSYDPVIIKALAGDKSDNIKNYRLVKDKSAMKIIDKGLDTYLKEKGRDQFDFNLQLVDLSRNPNLDDNIEYVSGVAINAKFDFKAIKSLVASRRITGLQSELVTKVMPFKNI